jgi:transcriptional regulator NrdR family protein
MRPGKPGPESGFGRGQWQRSAFAEAELTDRLSLTNAFAEANIDRKAAERIATEIFDAIHENVATKVDLQQLEQRMLLRLAELEHRLTVRFASIMVVLAGLLLAAIRYLPPASHG